MNFPVTINDLPPPPTGLNGFPWTEGSPLLPTTMPDGSPWLKVSIITPSYKQAQFLEETIRSVLMQGYPNLEYIIIDGGSTDGSVGIIKKYEPWLAYWVSERDRGHANAVNKAWSKCTGDIWAWLNSDDVYYPGALAKAIPMFRQVPDAKVVYGSAMFTNQEGAPLQLYQAKPLLPGMERLKLWKGWSLPQPSAFFDSRLIEKYGPLDETLRYSFDAEWFLRVSFHEKFVCIPDILATYRWHAESKTGVAYSNKDVFELDNRRILRRYALLRDPRSWSLYFAEPGNRLRVLMHMKYLSLQAFVRRIYGGTRRRAKMYGNKIRGSAP